MTKVGIISDAKRKIIFYKKGKLNGIRYYIFEDRKTTPCILKLLKINRLLIFDETLRNKYNNFNIIDGFSAYLKLSSEALFNIIKKYGFDKTKLRVTICDKNGTNTDYKFLERLTQLCRNITIITENSQNLNTAVEKIGDEYGFIISVCKKINYDDCDIVVFRDNTQNVNEENSTLILCRNDSKNLIESNSELRKIKKMQYNVEKFALYECFCS